MTRPGLVRTRTTSRSSAPRRTLLRRAGTAAASGLLALTVLGSAPAGAPAYAAEVGARRSPIVDGGVVVTPGNFTGYGFDQCLAPDSRAMRTWWNNSPFSAVGIYISGKSRACRNQPNLSKEWVLQQATLGWRLLPITLGPQASCQPRFPRYSDDVRINPKPGKKKDYHKALKMGRAEAETTVADARALGIAEGSTLWYDLEGFDASNTDCRESALSFLSGWTQKLHRLGYVSGVYSSASSGIAALDDARVERPDRFVLPDAIWIARWDGKANTDTTYIRDDGWRPGGRMKQYRGGHDEPASTSRTTRCCARRGRRRTARRSSPTPRWSPRCSACCARRSTSTATSPASTAPARSRPPAPGRPTTRCPRRTSGRASTGCRCSRPAPSRS